MSKSTKSKKAPNKKIVKPKFFCDEKLFDENLSVIKIEHCHECPIFNEKSTEFFKFICAKFPKNKFKLLLNESELDGTKLEPRFGAFELSFAKNCRLTYHLIWSGINRGPPRREKFPQDLEELSRKIQKLLVTG